MWESLVYFVSDLYKCTRFQTLLRGGGGGGGVDLPDKTSIMYLLESLCTSLEVTVRRSGNQDSHALNTHSTQFHVSGTKKGSI